MAEEQQPGDWMADSQRQLIAMLRRGGDWAMQKTPMLTHNSDAITAKLRELLRLGAPTTTHELLPDSGNQLDIDSAGNALSGRARQIERAVNGSM